MGIMENYAAKVKRAGIQKPIIGIRKPTHLLVLKNIGFTRCFLSYFFWQDALSQYPIQY